MKLPEIDFTPVSHPYPETTMFGVIKNSADRVPHAPALDFMGKITTYESLVKKIEDAAKAYSLALSHGPVRVIESKDIEAILNR